MFYLCSVDVYNYSYIYIYIYQYNFMTLPSRSFNHPFSNHKFEAYLAYRHYKCKLSITTSIVFLGKSFAKYFLSHTFNGLIVQYLYIYIYIYILYLRMTISGILRAYSASKFTKSFICRAF